jgi:LysM repeat protein
VATDAAAVECPVCGEGFKEAPARCFRCETDLSLWWPLDESLLVLSRAAPPVASSGPDDAAARERAGARWGWIILLGGLAGALWLHLESTRPPSHEAHGKPPAQARALPVAPPSVLAVPPSPRTVRYVVQPGDSLWRIAAALKGDPRRWPELIGERDGLDPARLQPGQELVLVLDGTPARKPD